MNYELIIQELTETIKTLRSEIPANPAAPRNERLEKELQNNLADYFKHIDNAIDINALEQLYYKNVKI